VKNIRGVESASLQPKDKRRKTSGTVQVLGVLKVHE
jgi:hypothetical protein